MDLGKSEDTFVAAHIIVGVGWGNVIRVYHLYERCDWCAGEFVTDGSDQGASTPMEGSTTTHLTMKMILFTSNVCRCLTLQLS